MLRTSLRIVVLVLEFLQYLKFLSSNAQDFIEDLLTLLSRNLLQKFLSSNAQDFIEEIIPAWRWPSMMHS